MDAKLYKITIGPAKYSEDGNIKTVETARISIDVPLDSNTQLNAVMQLMESLSHEWHQVDFDPLQKRLGLESDKSEGVEV